jgi:hypothetical protein
MALLSFRGINTPSLPAQGGQRRFSYFNIQRGNPSAPFEARSSTSVSQVPRPDFVPERCPPRTKPASRSSGEVAGSLVGLRGGAAAVDAGEFRSTASASTLVIAASRATFAVATSTAQMGGAVLCIVERIVDLARS